MSDLQERNERCGRSHPSRVWHAHTYTRSPASQKALHSRLAPFSPAALRTAYKRRGVRSSPPHARHERIENVCTQLASSVQDNEVATSNQTYASTDFSLARDQVLQCFKFSSRKARDLRIERAKTFLSCVQPMRASASGRLFKARLRDSMRE